MNERQANTPVSSEPEQTAAPTVKGLWPDAGAPPHALRVRSRGQDRTVPLPELDEVIACPPIARVPAAPSWLLGVAAYEGGLLPVVDLAAACGDPGSAAGQPGDRLLLVEIGVHRIAFSVDAIVSQAPDPLPGDGSPIALRALAAKLLGAAPGGHLARAEPAPP